MIDISLCKINKNYGFDNLFYNLTIDIKHGEHVAIIGDNGSGKSTLLNIIAGIDYIDSGIISIRNNVNIGYLKQIPDNNNLLVKEVLYQGLNKIINLKEQLTILEKNLTNKNINKYIKIQNEFISLGGYEIETKIGKITKLFQINDILLDKKFNELSGGEKTLISLASIIVMEPDILLLDEPTNHLDLNSLKWLEEYLNNYKGTIIIVSHDRYFLDKVATKIILLENKNIDIYQGNYSYYLEENKIRKELKIKDYNNQTKIINKMEKSIKQLKEFGRIGDNEDLFKRANSIQKRLDKIERLDKPKDKKYIPINFNYRNSTI